MTFSMTEVWNVVFAILAALGGGGAIVLGLSGWLGKLWADRFIEAEKGKIQTELARLNAELEKRIHSHNVAATRIDLYRAEAIQNLYGALIIWHEAAWDIVAPSNSLAEKPIAQMIANYSFRAEVLCSKSEKLDRIAMHTAIFFTEETYRIIAQCGLAASAMSINFLEVTRTSKMPNTAQHLQEIVTARAELSKKYEESYKPARVALIVAFRKIVDPIMPSNVN